MSDFEIVTIDPSEVLDRTLTTMEEYVGEALYPGDERRIFAEAMVAVHAQLANIMNDASKQTMLKYARGKVLDALGERLGVTRLPGASAHCTIRFSVQTPLEQDVEIPKFTKVTSDSTHYFAIPERVVLTAGTYWVESIAYAVNVGADYNGFTAGSITQLVDKVPYISKVQNMDETSGGDDGEPYTNAGDDRFRERIREAPNKLSCAGPRGAYQYWGLTSTKKIRDLQCVSEYETVRANYPVYDGNKLFIGGSHLVQDTLAIFLDGKQTADYKATYDNDLMVVTLGDSFKDETSVYIEIMRTLEGHVKIFPLMESGYTLDDEVKKEILSVLDDEKIRPMTDFVEVEAPHEVPFDIDITYTVTPTTESMLKEKIESSGGIIDQYIDWQTSKLGRDINPDTLRQLMLSAGWEDQSISGVLSVEITSPEKKELDSTEVAAFSGRKNINHIVKTGVI